MHGRSSNSRLAPRSLQHVALPLALALAAPVTRARAQAPITLDDIFATIPDVEAWCFEDFDLASPVDAEHRTGHYYFRVNTLGIRYTGYKEVDNELVLVEHQSRLDFECYIPEDWVDASTPPIAFPLLHIAKVDDNDVGQLPGETGDEKRAMATFLAKQGYVATILWNEDDHDDEGNPSETPPHSVFFADGQQNTLQRTGFTWITEVPPTQMTAQVLAFDFRFGFAQGAILAKTFFRRWMQDVHEVCCDENCCPEADPEQTWCAWIDSVKTVHHGGSKSGGGAITAAGHDEDCVGLRVSEYGGFDDGPESFMPRYASDWCEQAYASETGGLCEDEHYWQDFARWGWENEGVHPSYVDAYIVARDEDRYRDVLILDILGTHDWINPLGCSIDFWTPRDGWDSEGDVDEEEDVWDFRLVRRINKNHGIPSLVYGEGNPPPEGRMEDLVLGRMLQHLSAQASALPRMDLISVDTSSLSVWTARVRLTDVSLPEDFRVHVALSDDRDFRRCDSLVESHGNVCFNRPHDTNDEDDPAGAFTYVHPSEDIFLTIEVDEGTEVVATGDLRDIYFTPPAAALAEFFAESGADHPMVATIVELEMRDELPSLKGDLFLHTEVNFTHALSPASCPPPPECTEEG